MVVSTHFTVGGVSEIKASACNARDLGSIPGLGRSPREGNGNPLQHSCLENPMGGGARWATDLGVAELDTTEGLHLLTLPVGVCACTSQERAYTP